MLRSENRWLSIESVSTGYSVNGRFSEVVHDVSFSAVCGSLIGLIGPNGSGKSTLLRAIGGLLPIENGCVQIDSRDISAMSMTDRARSIAFLPQISAMDFAMTVYETVMMGRYPWQGMFGQISTEDSDWIRRAMEWTNVWPLRNDRLDRLSGGQQQRVHLAACLAQNPVLLLLDEPISHLDPGQSKRLMEVLKSRCRAEDTVGEGMPGKRITVIGIFHDLSAVRHYCDRVIALKSGRIIADGSPEQVLSETFIDRLYQTE